MFYTNKNAATAIRNKNEKISLEYGKEESSNATLKDMVVLMITFLIPLVIKTLLIYSIENKTIVRICYLIPFFFYSIITFLGIMRVRKDGKEFLRNHGAEHKVLAAYRKLKRIPTAEEANSFSRISNLCGTTMFSICITPQLIGFIVYMCTSYIVPEPLLFLITTLFITIFPFDFIGRLLQLFTTSKPKQCNIELAISALVALEQKELSDNIR